MLRGGMKLDGHIVQSEQGCKSTPRQAGYYQCRGRVVVLLLGTVVMSTSVKPAHQQIRRGMAETNDLFITEVFSRRNFDALNQIYTADARILPPGTPMISGGGEIKQFWSNLIQSVNARSAVLESVDVMVAGDSAIEIGRATLIVEDQAQNQMEVKYLVH